MVSVRCGALRGWAVLAVVGGLTLGGCASLRGSPEVVGAAPNYVTDAAEPNLIAANASQDSARRNMTKREWRDYVIDQELARVDKNYNAFLASLRQEQVGSNLALGLGALALSTAGTVADVDDANDLAAWTAGLIGARDTINKDLFFQRTMPALTSAMEANRKKVLVAIRASQTQSAEAYSLGAAMRDVRTYEMAGTVDMAIAQLTSLANEASAEATEQLAPAYRVVLLDKATSDRKEKLFDYIRSLETAGDLDKLTKIALLIGIKQADITGKAVDALENDVRFELNRQTQSNDAAVLDELSKTLNPVTGLEF